MAQHDCDDIRGILALEAAFTRHDDLREWPEFTALFADEMVLEAFGSEYVGPDAVTAFISQFPPGKHMLSTPAIELNGDRGTVAVDYAFYRYPSLDLIAVGGYRDEVVKVDGSWKFARREILVHGRAEVT